MGLVASSIMPTKNSCKYIMALDVSQTDFTTVHTGQRAVGHLVARGGHLYFRKIFMRNRTSWVSFFRERRASKILKGQPWVCAWARSGWTLDGRPWFEKVAYPQDARFDVVVGAMGPEQRRHMVAQALSIVLDLYVAQLVHHDLHVGNLFVIEGQLKLVDFEFLSPFPDDYRPTFRESYDITGQGLPSPARTNHMGLNADRGEKLNKKVITRLAGVSMDEALQGLAEILKGELLVASTTFQTARTGSRHTCKVQRSYCSFRVPGLCVPPEETQRNSARRFERYGIQAQDLAGKRILDVGCHAGGMLFAAQKFQPRECLGVEYDAAKVRVAKRIAAFAELPQVKFQQADVDRIRARDLRGDFEVTFCFALEKHVRKPKRLYRLLGQVTRELLLFETNARTDPIEVERQLRQNGFQRIEHLGVCDDDVLAENNVRHLIKAWK